MDVALALLADAANLSADGKLNVLGAFDAVRARTFPATHARLVLVLQLEAHTADWDKPHPLAIRFINEDGKELFKMEASITVPAGADPARPARFTNQFQINGLRFDRPGDYAFDILLDGATAKRLPLRVDQLPPAPAAPSKS